AQGAVARRARPRVRRRVSAPADASGRGAATDLAPDLARTRWQFGLLGMAAGTWGAHIPSVQRAHGLDAGRLSMVLLAAALGCVAMLWVAGRAVARSGTRRAARVAALAMLGVLGAVLWIPDGPLLLGAAFVLGAGMALFDVCINSEGAEIERIRRRAVMSQLHGLWSVGAMAGALTTSALLAAQLAPRLQLGAIALGLGAALLLVTRSMAGAPPPGRSRAGVAWPTRGLWWIGALVFAGMTAEGALHDWTVLYLAQERALPHAQAALGYAVFTVAMAGSRFAGDALRVRLGEARLLGVGAVLAAASMAWLLLAPAPLAYLGLAGVGAGIAPMAPILLIAAARARRSEPAAGIAAVTAIGYFGLMLGPPLVGGIAQAGSLALALAVVVIGPALVLAIGVRYLRGLGAAVRPG
ncbi:MAG: MFS transporter, partial [Burkholderiaceae bacterium]